jgi:tetratricopeptide (TPR) repeat protein
MGRSALATAAYERALARRPTMAEAAYNLANLYFELGELEKSLSYYERVLESKPTFAGAREGAKRARRRLFASPTPATSRAAR